MEEKRDIKIDSMGQWKRTHDCGDLRGENIGEDVLLMGWVNTRRDLGHLIFIDLRDRGGITQIVFDPKTDQVSHERAHVLRNEWVIAVKGRVSRRIEGQENLKLETGEIELQVHELRILNRTETPPFQVDGPVDASENLRLKHRYLELRRPGMLKNFVTRHRTSACIREYLNDSGFLEVETPFLTKSTPEGARDYLVPSRVNRGLFYALPQSPQLFKQLLMIAGFDRYYQIVRCFRDEDLRADRQPEFTQVDIEMAFVDEEAVIGTVEGMIKRIFKEILEKEISLPLPRLEYHEAMKRFGTDRPDTRFGLELIDISGPAGGSEFRVFTGAVERGGVIKALNVKGGSVPYSRKKIDDIAGSIKEFGAKGLAWIKITENGWQSSLEKFFSDEGKKALDRLVDAEQGDLILIVADSEAVVNSSLGFLRLRLAREMDLIPADEYAFTWINRFPLLEHDEAEDRLTAVHHPFTAPLEEDLRLLEESPERVRARSYDIVLNGSEIGGGSVRIHDLDTQQRVFKILGIPEDEANKKFGFLLDALKYGAPPHGGIALGLDRLVAILAGAASIREVIAFPKTTSATCPLTEAPSGIAESQLKELALKLDSKILGP